MPALPSSLPVLHTARLVLRAVTMDDIDDLRAVYGDPDVMRYGSDPAFSQDADYLQTVASIERKLVERIAIEWGMVLKSSGTMIGVMGLHHFEGSHAEVGCLLARRYWGQRLMPEALSALLSFAHDIGLVRLEAEIGVGNARSERLFSGLGFARIEAPDGPAVWSRVL